MINGSILYLPSLSVIDITTALGLPRVTSLGSEVESIISMKVSCSSNISSSFIGILSEAVVIPGVNVTLYGPDL